MNWKSDCAVVIPCFNEGGRIALVVAGLRRHLEAVFVVDDGSWDATAVEAEKAGAIVLKHQANQGKGAALQTGWKAAYKAGFLWAISVDGDGQHAAEDIPGFLETANRTSASLVIGNRMPGAAAMPGLRRCVNQFMSRRISKISGQTLPDTQCGFRLMDLKIWAELEIEAEHFEIESEILLGFIRARQRVEFVPIQVIYKDEHSKIDPLRDTIRWLRWLRGVRRPARGIKRKLDTLRESKVLSTEYPFSLKKH
jgi:glycosyltransferase involved in cell wall biosynthesis